MPVDRFLYDFQLLLVRIQRRKVSPADADNADNAHKEEQ